MQEAFPQKEVSPAGRLRGYIRKINPVRGWGYIHLDSGKDYFFHRNNIRRSSYRVGAIVEFTPVRVDEPGLEDRATAIEEVR